MFYTKCYNGHIILLDDKYLGVMIECPYCKEEYIAYKLEDDQEPIEGM